jgi:uncharacterized phage protein (TIGR02218 family)
MIQASSALIAHLGGRATTLAMLWRVTRTDGQVFGFTSHDRDLVADGLTHRASLGIQPSALQEGVGLAVGNAEVQAAFASEAITEADLRAGVWDHADVRVRLVNWADPSMGTLKMLRGWLGEVSFDGFTYRAELRGLADLLNRNAGEIVTPGCSAILGDARCQKVLTDYTTTAEVTAVTSNREFDTDLSARTVRLNPGSTPTATGAPPAGYFISGKLTWLTGANAGRAMEVKDNDASGAVWLQLAMEGTVQPGDTFSIVAGCAKSRDVCRDQFDNLLNFRGFPEVPGLDKLMMLGGQ